MENQWKWSGISRILPKSLHLEHIYKCFLIVISELQNVEFHYGKTYFSENWKSPSKSAWITSSNARPNYFFIHSESNRAAPGRLDWSRFPNFKILSFTMVKPTFLRTENHLQKVHELPTQMLVSCAFPPILSPIELLLVDSIERDFRTSKYWVSLW